MATKALAAALTLVASAAAMGQWFPQPQWTKRVDHPDAEHNTEVVLAVSKTHRDIMVAWMHASNDQTHDPMVYYNVSVDGNSFKPTSTAVPLPTGIPGTGPLGADPMVLFQPDGIGWVGYVQSPGGGALRDRFWVAEKPIADDATLPAKEILITPTPSKPDKGVLAYGPRLGSTGGDDLTLAFAHQYATGTCSGMSSVRYHLRSMYTQDLVNWTWSDHTAIRTPGMMVQGNMGGPNRAFILRDDPGTFGRWIIAYHHQEECPPDRRSLPWSAYSNDGGMNWLPSVRATRATNPYTPSLQEDITWNQNSYDNWDVARLEPGMVNGTVNTPDLALDPNDDNTMYMIFSGTAESTRPATGKNVDLFIARSTDGGADFAGSPLGDDVLHLRDVEELGFALGERVHQFLPAITVDGFGGLNIMYYAARKNASNIWEYSVRYLRIPQFSNAAPAGIERHDLTGWFDMESVNFKTFGHYMIGDSRGCEVYFAYVSAHEDSTVPGVYVSYFNMCIDADVDADTQVTSADADLFTALFAAEDPRADLNGDGLFTIEDVNRFQASYACGCNP